MPTPRFVQRLGLAVIAIGLVAGAAVYLHATDDPDGADAMPRTWSM